LANLDLNKKFISVITEDKINDLEYVESVIKENREYSINNREEILEYAKEFEMEKILIEYNMKHMQEIIDRGF
jgi:hypothetical protein